MPCQLCVKEHAFLKKLKALLLLPIQHSVSMPHFWVPTAPLSHLRLQDKLCHNNVADERRYVQCVRANCAANWAILYFGGYDDRLQVGSMSQQSSDWKFCIRLERAAVRTTCH